MTESVRQTTARRRSKTSSASTFSKCSGRSTAIGWRRRKCWASAAARSTGGSSGTSIGDEAAEAAPWRPPNVKAGSFVRREAARAWAVPRPLCRCRRRDADSRQRRARSSTPTGRRRRSLGAMCRFPAAGSSIAGRLPTRSSRPPGASCWRRRGQVPAPGDGRRPACRLIECSYRRAVDAIVICALRATLPSGVCSKSGSSSRKRWRASAGWLAASRTTSTTC